MLPQKRSDGNYRVRGASKVFLRQLAIFVFLSEVRVTTPCGTALVRRRWSPRVLRTDYTQTKVEAQSESNK